MFLVRPFFIFPQGLWMSVRHEVLYVIATRIRFMCPMNYAKFPIDIQTCKFQVS